MQTIERQLFLRRGAKLPDQLQLRGQAIGADWLALSGDADALDKQVFAAGWHFFRLAEKVEAWALRLSKNAAAEAARRKALKQVKASRNVAEIESVLHRSLLGLKFCQVRLAVRHIQPEAILSIAPSVGIISPAAKPETLIGKLSQGQELAT